jgi:hypothetical protein
LKLKAVAIRDENAIAIEAALHAVNGRARDHAYTSPGELSNVARTAEKQLEELRLPLKERIGARYLSISGAPVPNAYKGTRVGTALTLVRRASGWFLENVQRAVLYNSGGGRNRLTVTSAQDQGAVRRLRARYTVAVSVAAAT